MQPDLPPAVAAARALVADLVVQGVRDVVLAPGSRSAPLAYALAEAASVFPRFRLHVRVDERAAGFLALGLSKGAEPLERGAGPGAGTKITLPRPVAVVTTSGTAVANLHPAVLEAHHTGVPLLLLTADRPHELRGTGASQTTDQVGIFGSAVRFAADVPAPSGRDGEVRDLLGTAGRALAAALGLRDRNPGPVHLNLAYREPLQPAGVLDGAGDGARRVWPEPSRRTVVQPSAPGPGADPALYGDPARTLVVAGDGAGPQARALAEAQGWPLLAEPSSGACGGPNGVQAYRAVLGVEELVADVEHVVVLGRPTLSRPVQRLLGRQGVTVTVVTPGGAPWPDAARNAEVVVDRLAERWFVAPSDRAASRPFLARWQAASRAADRVLRALTGDDATPAPPSGAAAGAPGALPAGAVLADVPHAALAVARAVAAAAGPDDVLVVGSSNPVRDLDLVLGLDAAPSAPAPAVLANRGLAGIDGLVSTAYGVALGGVRGRTRALLGDLTFLHDAGGLLRGPHEPTADLQLVVVNDDGGSIFATLEHGTLAASSGAGREVFERVFGTPHGADLAALCAGYGVRHRRVHDLTGLRAALADPGRGVEVVEVRVPRADRLAESRQVAARVVDAVRGALGSA
ncbi:2-succinyl-5-enolpyruvyl-6-hydroxy-3-cyclohexene-1-carboxylic-acid synthase [Xylanimonas oleitrophica]|uniref:2-succinyl-5-enolpyruvyl-6-hydroxy-3-cyclohexene-1-carboxylate synthase n=1 Tax=Xylanimonas oleitrophica TaxID=2607479 RepID=A0A2W5WKU5_9MICO|nr:2-succinyl-5-enolpyruvyl-6-hydroxy-3-cyclohexene-1-carboxylic-acid synthase [Xylanimonas oleitrophica]